MAEQVWLEREVPILEALAVAEANSEQQGTAWVVQETGLDELAVQLGVEALIEAAYISGGVDVSSMADVMPYYTVLSLREKGRRAVNQWPEEGADFDQFLEVLNAQIEDADDEDEKSRLRQLRDTASAVGRPVVAGVLTAWVKTQVGL